MAAERKIIKKILGNRFVDLFSPPLIIAFLLYIVIKIILFIFPNTSQTTKHILLMICLFFWGVLDVIAYNYAYKHDLYKKHEVVVWCFWNLLMIILIFAVVYSSVPYDTNNYFLENGMLKNLTFSDATYFSATTIATVGYGDIVPNGIFRWYAISEILLGIILIGTFVAFISGKK